MLSKREWGQVESAIEKMQSPDDAFALIYRKDVFNFLKQWVDKEGEDKEAGRNEGHKTYCV